MPKLIDSFSAIAEMTAKHLAADATTSREVREAITTVRLEDNAIRIGEWDIIIHEAPRHYSIRSKHTGKTVFSDIPFYDVAISLVRSLNAGQSPTSVCLSDTNRTCQAYNRTKSDIQLYSSQADCAKSVDKQELFEHRLSAAEARLSVLKARLESKCR